MHAAKTRWWQSVQSALLQTDKHTDIQELLNIPCTEREILLRRRNELSDGSDVCLLVSLDGGAAAVAGAGASSSHGANALRTKTPMRTRELVNLLALCVVGLSLCLCVWHQ